MSKRLLCWLGMTDLDCSRGEKDGLGPIGQALHTGDYEVVHILTNYAKDEVSEYTTWVKSLSNAKVKVHRAKLSSPMDFDDVYKAAVGVIKTARYEDEDADLTYHVSPGTSVMAAVWIILAGSTYPAALINSSPQRGVEQLRIPLAIASEYAPELIARTQAVDEGIAELATGTGPTNPAFEHILHQSAEMKTLIQRATRVASRSLHVLFQGESGTGKELFARAIHNASGRANKEFVPVNCGAIPKDLVEAELFGFEKGAFTGANAAKDGFIQAADGGTLFLDELGEMPLHIQVKLLRVIQEGEVRRIGATKAKKVDLRIVSATNRDLLKEVLEERFREDLYHRLAVIVFQIPPFRERTGDLTLLIDHILKNANAKFSDEPGFVEKRLTPQAKQRLLSHSWPGNYRELNNVIVRALFWSTGETITLSDVKDAMLPTSQREQILGRPLDENFDLQKVLDEVETHYQTRAWEQTGGKKSAAYKLLGFNSYQTMDKRRNRLGLNDG